MSSVPLWKHQETSIEFCLNHKSAGVFSGMGSGKTRIGIELIKQSMANRVLIVVTKTVLTDNVWGNQLHEYMDTDCTHLWLNNGTAHQKATRLREEVHKNAFEGKPLIVTINYDSVWRSPLGSFIVDIPWDLIILDEGHHIKAAGSRVSKFMAGLAKKRPNARKVVLTGTPTPNGPLDLYGIYRFLDSSIFGTRFDDFKNRYARFGGFNNYQILEYRNLDELTEKMSKIAIRFRTEDVIDLPPIFNITRKCDLTAETTKLYNELDKEMTAEVQDGRITVSNILVKSLRLQQITGGYSKVDDREELVRVGDDKEKLLEEVLDEIPQDFEHPSKHGFYSEPIVVFCKFLADIKVVVDCLVRKGYVTGLLTGSIKNLDKWHAGELEALVVQIDSGAEGIDLTRAAYGIYYSNTFDLGVYEQSKARLHRPGQTKPTRFIHLLARNTIDIDILYALANKIKVNEYVHRQYERRTK